MNFKLIAIRPLLGCRRKYLKILEENKPYVFYNEYDFTNYSDDNRIVAIDHSKNINLYSYPYSNLDINISAIVGKNGSGKSSIVELLYISLYNISIITKILQQDYLKKSLNLKDIEKGIKVELFYETDNDLLMLQLIDDNIVVYEYLDGCFCKINQRKFDMKNFFYSIAINYSHYALNSRDIGNWINNVCHKNDAYQTPLVINPMRIDGNIDINRENYLVRSRLLANILSKDKNLRVLAEGKTVKSLRFSLINEKLQKKSRLSYSRYEIILPKLYKYFLKNEEFEPEKSGLNDYTVQYIVGKVYDICHKYKQYSRFIVYFGAKSKDSKGIERFSDCLYNDRSHITFKLRQAIYFLKYGSCVNKDDLDVIFIDSLGDGLKNFKTNYEKILPSLFKYFLKDENFKPQKTKLNTSIKQYIIERIYEVCHENQEYIAFKKYFGKNYKKSHLDRFAKKLKKDSSSNLQDIEKAIVSLRKDTFNTVEDIESLSNKIYKIKANGLELIEIIPPSFIDIEILFDEGENTFERLSSGEKQKIYAISSLIYHLVNLDSVTEEINYGDELSEKLIKYRYINFIFDEIELYYHPELQRTFIKDLLDRISLVEFKHIRGINCIFITHSPFILSDIPLSNILILDSEGISINEKVVNTFGANIHDLLKNSFFLHNGAMGEFAKEKIKETIDFIEYSKLKKYLISNRDYLNNIDKYKQIKIKMKSIRNFKNQDHKNRIEIIGESILRAKLFDMYNQVFKDSDKLSEVQAEIARLKERERKLLIKYN
ncbi:hypothetical protein E0494_03980 [Marinilabiliaceae bacterium JC040]|nr:hypothetical protein [Marinilabiliaceae bacterium JC040]